MKNNKKTAIKAVALAVILVSILTVSADFCAAGTSMYAEEYNVPWNHKHLEEIHVTNSGVLIVGASRVAFLYRAGYRNCSIIGVSGGKFYTDPKNNCKTINSQAYLKGDSVVPYAKSRHMAIITSIFNSLKKHHVNKTILVAPTNDICYDPTDEQIRQRALKLAKYAENLNRTLTITRNVPVGTMKKTVNGRLTTVTRFSKRTFRYRNRVYVMGCTLTEGGVYANTHDTVVYNNELKRLASRYHYTYVPLRNAYDSEFRDDGLHFKHGKIGYNKYMIDRALSLKY